MGLGFYRELAHRHPHLLARVIFLTGDVLSPEAEAFFVQSARPYVIKPFTAQAIRQAIQQVLDATVGARAVGTSGQHAPGGGPGAA